MKHKRSNNGKEAQKFRQSGSMKLASNWDLWEDLAS